MFDQTFVDGTQKTNKPITLLASTLIQISILFILLLIPLIYTATLPGASLKSLLIAPPPPPVVTVPATTPKVQTGHVLRVLSARALYAPVAIPKQVNVSSDIAAPPDIAVVGVNGQSGGPVGSGLSALEYTIPTAPPPAPPKVKAVPGAIRVGTGVAEANIINKVMPAYPALAKAARIQGTVEFSATISKEGNIENLQLVHGHPLLVKAARDAVLQWKYRPTLLNGQPVEVLTQIVVNFTLAQ